MKGIWAVPVFAGILLLSIGLSQDAYAIHQSEEVVWQLVTISSYPACSNYHHQITNQYDDITEKYFELYQFENSKYPPICLTEDKYSSEYEAPEDLDLLILVYDRNLGRAELHPYGFGGIYNHFGEEWTKNHTIIFCDCSNFQYSDPTWILSHELSHFILFYLGLEESIVEDHIHQLDEQYDTCVEADTDEREELCNFKTTKLDAYSYHWNVISPYEPAVGKSPLEVTQSTETESPFGNELQKEITRWWLKGKISEEDYIKSIDLFMQDFGVLDQIQKRTFLTGTINIAFADDPKFDGKDWTNYDRDTTPTDSELKKILKRVPYISEMNENVPQNDQELPEWFETRAIWWSLDTIDDAEFAAGLQHMLERAESP